MGILMQKALSLVGLLILIRLLQPEDYGAIAAMLLVIGLFDQFTTIPFGDALVQRKGEVERYIDPLWTWDLVRTTIIAFIIAFLAGPLADYFQLQGIARQLMPWVGFAFLLIPASGNPRQVYFFRKLDLRRVFIRDVVAQLSFLFVAVSYVLVVDRSVMALFLGHVARFTSAMVMSYVLYPAWPRLSFSFGRLRDLMGFGKWAYGQNVVEYAASVADRFLVGGLMGAERLGLYARSRDLALTASGILAGALDKVGMPVYARIQDEREKLQQGILKSIDVFALTAVPFSLLLLLEGGTLVPLVFGMQWISIVLPLKIFAVGGLAFGLSYILQPLFTGIGRPDIVFRLHVIEAIVTLPLLYIGGMSRGPIGLAAAVSMGWFVTLLFGVWYARPILRLDKRTVLPVLLPSLAAVTLTTLVDIAGRDVVHATGFWLLNLIWVGCLGIVYVVLVLVASKIIGQGPYSTVSGVLNQLWSWLRSRISSRSIDKAV